MVLLYFVGVFASYLLVLSRENKRFPWQNIPDRVANPHIAHCRRSLRCHYGYGYKLVLYWPFLTK